MKGGFVKYFLRVKILGIIFFLNCFLVLLNIIKGWFFLFEKVVLFKVYKIIIGF